MILSIESNTLLPLQKEFLFRKNTLSALRKIIESGFNLVLSGDALSEQQEKMFQQEEIKLSDSNSFDFEISYDNKTLVLKDRSGKIVSTSDFWLEIAQILTHPERKASIHRKTKETEIKVDLNLDGTGKSTIDTGLKFFDHMLEQIARHGLVDLDIFCKGDLEVDEHHTIEDVAIALGEAITNALGDKKGIERYSFVLPMDEAQSTVAMDLSGRPYLVFDVPMKREYVGDFPTEMLEHFFYSLSMNLKATLHVTCKGDNDHHKIEACFKGFARTLKTAIEQNGRIKDQIPSSKGSL
ncbi:MAG: imidazoleglycerol-phosphate dehydratase HisB [Balneola sp.]